MRGFFLSHPSFEWLMLFSYLFLGPLMWAWIGFCLFNGRDKMRILVRPHAPLPNPPPKISVLIPAKDEAGQIEKCVSSVLAQDYPNFELIVINDRSTDNTGRILDNLAAKDSRLRVVHLKEGSLPTGWGGKSFALHNGLMQATGDWLLFVDADVQLEPDVMSATIARAIERKYDLVSLLPLFVSGTMSEGILQPLAGAATSAMFLISLTNSDKNKVAFANGQYLCVRRDAYEAVGGHEAIRGTLSEDVALVRKLKAAEYRPRLGWGETWATVRMYEGFAAIFRGWSRNFYVGSLGNPFRISVLMFFLWGCVYSIIGAATYATHSHAPLLWITAIVLHYLMMTAVAALIYVWAHEPWWYALLLPISCLVLLAIAHKALWICWTGKVSWRGTQYTRKALDGQ
jgi:glycosyltransferase involved in cell wall biosynthesis